MLQRDPSALWSQVHNRLQHDPEGVAMATLGTARRSLPWVRALPSAAFGQALVRTIATSDRVTACRFTPDGSALVVAEGTRVTIRGLDGAVQTDLPAPGAVIDCAVAGTMIVAIGGDGRTSVWDRSGARLAGWQAYEGRTHACALTPDGTMVVTAGGDEEDGHLAVWAASDGTLLHTLRGPQSAVRACTMLPDGISVASTGSDGGLWVHDLRTGSGRHLVTHFDTGFGCAVHPGGDFFVVAGYTGALTVWGPAGEQLARLKGHDRWALDCAVSPDGSLVVSAGEDGTVRLWDPANGWASRALTGHTSRVACCEVSPDGRLVATGGVDATVRVWDACASSEVTEGHDDRVRSCAVGPDGSWAATGGADGTIRIWDLPGGTSQSVIRSSDRHYGLTALGDGSGLASIDGNGSIDIWGLGARRTTDRFDKPRRTIVGPAGSHGWACAAATDGSWVAAAGSRLAVVDTMTGEVRWAAPDVSGRAVAVVPPNRLVASIGGVPGAFPGAQRGPGAVKVVDARTGEIQATLELDGDIVVNDLDVAPSGGLVAAACSDWAVRVWDLDGGPPIAILRATVPPDLQRALVNLESSFTGFGERRATTGCRFLDDGRIVAAGFDGSLRLWDLSATTPLAVAFLPNPVLGIDVWRPGRLVVCGDASGGVHRLVAEIGPATGSFDA